LQLLHFHSPVLDTGDAQVRVLLPKGYDPSGKTRYPVLYLLHGADGSSANWTTAGDAERATADFPLIVVMPDGGSFGFYTDWWNFGSGRPPLWETFHLYELLPWIDTHYRTIANRDGRALAGESMGGLGAMHYAAKRPDMFTAAVSFSGAVDVMMPVAPPIVEVSGMAEGDNVPAGAFGPRATEEVRWRGQDPVDLVDNLRGLFLELDTGNGSNGGPMDNHADPIELGMYVMDLNLHNHLQPRGIDHVWNDYGPGCHCWNFWQRDLRQALPRLMARFAHPTAPPSPFAYTSIDPSYSVYGWRVSISRPAVEFSRLDDAGPNGFALTGSGTAQVTTAAMFKPGQIVRATINDAAGIRRIAITADRAGRLTVPASLGPGNPFQQFTALGTVWGLATGWGFGWPSRTATVTFTR
jgi:S-formylglutathione hydrolase FrmB